MEFAIKKLPRSQAEIEIKISAPEFQGFVDKVISQLGQNIEVEGFRKGKVPKEILEEKIGQEKILNEAIQLAIKESYLGIVRENKLEAIGSPEIEILSPTTFQKNQLEQATYKKSGGGFTFKARVAVIPEIQMPDYRKIAANFSKKEILVEEKEIEEVLAFLQQSRAKFSQITRPAQKGDFVEIELVSPEIEEKTKQKDAFILGQGHLIPGFEEKLEGMEAGQAKSFSLQFPGKHFQKDLAGKKVNFEVSMLSVQKVELPPINDQFARSLGHFSDLAALKSNITQGLNLKKETQESQRLRQEILEKTIQEISWDLPEVLILAEKNRILEIFKKEATNKFQVSFEEYLKKSHQTKEQILDSFQPEAEVRLKGYLVLNKISQIENIQVPEEEVKAEINKILRNYPNIEAVEKGLDLEKLKLYIKGELKNEKTLQFLERLAISA